MRTVIAATDFSTAAKNAAHYACQLARNIHATVRLVHFESVASKLFKVVSMSAKDMNDKMTAHVESLNRHCPDVQVTTEIIAGHVADGLRNYVHSHGEPVFVVIGNHYDKDHPTFMDGHIMQIFKNLQCPVIAVPEEKQFETFKNICLAFDGHINGAKDAIARAKAMVTDFNINLHVLMGMDDVYNRDNLPDVSKEVAELFASANPVYHFIRNEHLNENIVDFIKKHHIDVLAMIPRSHYGLVPLMHKSHTQYMVNNSNIPVMALHED